jgi:hypothetical protein
MILLNFRVHRTGVNRLTRFWRDPRRISFQGHAALRTLAGLVRFNAGTHRAKMLGSERRFHFRVAVTVMFVTAATGMFLRSVCVFVAAVVGVLIFAVAAIAGCTGRFSFRSTATTAVRCGGRSLRKKFLPAMFAAKVKQLSVTLGAKSRRFIHRHSANRVFGHAF